MLFRSLGANRCEAAFNPPTQIVGDDRFCEPVPDIAIVGPAVTRIDHDHLVRNSSASHRVMVFRAKGCRRSTLHSPRKTVERPPDRWSARSVLGQAHVALEFSQCPIGIRTEDAIDPSGIKAEGVQPLLQTGDVIAGSHVAG